VQQTRCEPLFPDVQMQSETNFFVPCVRPCIHHKYDGISESHACKDCVWPIILDAELYTTCSGERVLVAMTHQVECNIPTFEALLRKNRYLFFERCRRCNNVWLLALTKSDCLYSYILWTLQPHFTLLLSARTLQCLFVWGCACHNAFVLYLTLTS